MCVLCGEIQNRKATTDSCQILTNVTEYWIMHCIDYDKIKISSRVCEMQSGTLS